MDEAAKKPADKHSFVRESWVKMAKSAQSVMLALICKRTDPVDLKAPLLTFVRATYSDAVADDTADDLVAINQLRNEVTNSGLGASPALRENMAKYIRALCAMETRFAVGKEKGQAALSFTWCVCGTHVFASLLSLLYGTCSLQRLVIVSIHMYCERLPSSMD